MATPLPLCLGGHAEGTVLRVHLQPRARRTGVVGWFGERLKVAVGGPPVDGKANAELCRFLAAAVGVPRSAVLLIQGETSRDKTVLIRGLAAEAVRSRLQL